MDSLNCVIYMFALQTQKELVLSFLVHVAFSVTPEFPEHCNVQGMQRATVECHQNLQLLPRSAISRNTRPVSIGTIFVKETPTF